MSVPSYNNLTKELPMNLKLVFTESFIISLVCATGFALIAILVGERILQGSITG
jgi:hypothetical protein